MRSLTFNKRQIFPIFRQIWSCSFISNTFERENIRKSITVPLQFGSEWAYDCSWPFYNCWPMGICIKNTYKYLRLYCPPPTVINATTPHLVVQSIISSVDGCCLCVLVLFLNLAGKSTDLLDDPNIIIVRIIYIRKNIKNFLSVTTNIYIFFRIGSWKTTSEKIIISNLFQTVKKKKLFQTM